MPSRGQCQICRTRLNCGNQARRSALVCGRVTGKELQAQSKLDHEEGRPHILVKYWPNMVRLGKPTETEDGDFNCSGFGAFAFRKIRVGLHTSAFSKSLSTISIWVSITLVECVECGVSWSRALAAITNHRGWSPGDVARSVDIPPACRM